MAAKPTPEEITTADPPGAAARPSALAGIGRRTLLMGILNITPDSFSDGGLFAGRDAAVEHGLALAREGADILDIGGESTRPGYRPVSAEEEQARVLPVIRHLAGCLAVPISIDTYKAATARAALEAGARIVNDTWGFQREPDVAAVAAAHDAVAVVMHNRDTIDPSLDILDELRAFFDRSLAIARRAGLPDRDIVLDPGLGFGKTAAQQLEVLRRLPAIRAFGFPVLVGISRKSLLGGIAPRETRPEERLFASVGAHVLSATLGADIVRVHDVRAHAEALRVVDATMRRPS